MKRPDKQIIESMQSRNRRRNGLKICFSEDLILVSIFFFAGLSSFILLEDIWKSPFFGFIRKMKAIPYFTGKRNQPYTNSSAISEIIKSVPETKYFFYAVLVQNSFQKFKNKTKRIWLMSHLFFNFARNFNLTFLQFVDIL